MLSHIDSLELPEAKIEREIPNIQAGIVIGRAGETIRDIQARTGARVQVSRQPISGMRIVTIEGSEQQVRA